ncbi:hypothetical protein V492_07432 [Pseudogymnoascus sp. VKM F-4246]|nr:hypothetical protein V492_07432 [Pseudogymnoascus sp. VKM F-4246]
MAVLSREFKPEPDSELFDPETGMCSIEYYASCKDPYRVASNKIPVGWPWLCARASEAANDLNDQLYERIQKVLSDYNISGWANNYNFAPRYTPEDAHDIYLIRTRDKFNASWWRKAADEIYNDIIEPAATAVGIEMTVEIWNEDKMYRDASSLITDDAIINSIAKIQPAVLGTVMEHCPMKWTSIAYHNRGPPSNGSEQKLTVIVFIRPGEVHAWGELEDNIIHAITSSSFPNELDIHVEILPGELSLTRPTGRPLYHGIDNLPTIPSPGASIAPSNCTDAAGTLGAVVNYRAAPTEEVKRCFLTSYDVIASGDPDGKELNDVRGIGLNKREVGFKIDVEYPSKYDPDHARRSLKTRLQKNEEYYKHYMEGVKHYDDIAALGPIGQVKFASGYRLSDTNHRMDWALVELDPARPAKNLLPSDTSFFRSGFLHNLPGYIVQDGDTVSGTCTSISNTPNFYAKVGRTSGVTPAQYSPLKRAIA